MVDDELVRFIAQKYYVSLGDAQTILSYLEKNNISSSDGPKIISIAKIKNKW